MQDENPKHNVLLRTQGDPALEYSSTMDKKEINSPKLTANFLIWVCGVGGLLLAYVLAHFVWNLI